MLAPRHCRAGLWQHRPIVAGYSDAGLTKVDVDVDAEASADGLVAVGVR
jgi:hypothetical protein